MVLAILAIITSLALPLLRDRDALALRMAGQQLMADLAVAQQESIAHSDNPRRLTVNNDGTGYYLATKNSPTTPITHPIDKSPYRVTFGQGAASQLGGVRIAAYSLGGDASLVFGAYGQLDQTALASLTLSCGRRTLILSVDPTSGDASVGELN